MRMCHPRAHRQSLLENPFTINTKEPPFYFNTKPEKEVAQRRTYLNV